MTNQNNAAQPVLTDDEINAACGRHAADTGWHAQNDRKKARAVESALLSKRRAPVADERVPHHDQPQQTGVGEWCAPGPAAEQRRAWLLRFADTERGDCVYYDEQEARRAFAQAEGRGWNCYLFEFARRAALASAPVAGGQFKAAFPNGVLPVEKYHELWERAGEKRNPNYTLLDNLTWQVGMFGDLVAKEVSAPVAGEAQKPLGYVAVLNAPCSARYFSRITDQHQAQVCAAQWAKEYANVKPGPWLTEAVAVYAAPQASEADPLQGAADWLMRAFEPPLSASDLARQLVIGYNRATRLRDAALSAQPGAQRTGGCDAE